jgi:hypothetical protein
VKRGRGEKAKGEKQEFSLKSGQHLGFGQQKKDN